MNAQNNRGEKINLKLLSNPINQLSSTRITSSSLYLTDKLLYSFWLKSPWIYSIISRKYLIFGSSFFDITKKNPCIASLQEFTSEPGWFTLEESASTITLSIHHALNTLFPIVQLIQDSLVTDGTSSIKCFFVENSRHHLHQVMALENITTPVGLILSIFDGYIKIDIELKDFFINNTQKLCSSIRLYIKNFRFIGRCFPMSIEADIINAANMYFWNFRKAIWKIRMVIRHVKESCRPTRSIPTNLRPDYGECVLYNNFALIEVENMTKHHLHQLSLLSFTIYDDDIDRNDKSFVFNPFLPFSPARQCHQFHSNSLRVLLLGHDVISHSNLELLEYIPMPAKRKTPFPVSMSHPLVGCKLSLLEESFKKDRSRYDIADKHETPFITPTKENDLFRSNSFHRKLRSVTVIDLDVNEDLPQDSFNSFDASSLLNPPAYKMAYVVELD